LSGKNLCLFLQLLERGGREDSPVSMDMHEMGLQEAEASIQNFLQGKTFSINLFVSL
jgi:hypothetical protein